MTSDTDPAPDVGEATAKLARLDAMIATLLSALHDCPMDDAAEHRLADIHHRVLLELGAALSDKLIDELWRLGSSLPAGQVTLGEVRLAHAQLLGWMNGLLLTVLVGPSCDAAAESHDQPFKTA